MKPWMEYIYETIKGIYLKSWEYIYETMEEIYLLNHGRNISMKPGKNIT